MEEGVKVNLGIHVGMKFADLTEFQENLKTECKLKYVQFSISSSRTVEAARNKVKRYLNPGLKFYSVHWACVHGGRQYRNRGKGIRKTMTLRREQLCPAHIHVIVSDSGNEFVVSSVNYKHNHLVSQQLFKQLPHNRKLVGDIKNDTRKLLQGKVNNHNKRSCDSENRLDKCVASKDPEDLLQLRGEEMQTICNQVQLKFGADCHLLLDNNDVFKGLTCCSKQMMSSFSAFPEFICVDATHKLLNIKIPFYVVLNVDGNGESGVVAMAVLIQEDQQSLEWFLETFKSCNPTWSRIQHIMSDKDSTNRELLSKVFPDAQSHICIFDAMKIFQDELTCEKFDIISIDRITILERLQHLVHSKNEVEFDKILEKIKCDFPKKLFTYLSQNWVNTKEEWCPLLGEKVNNFMNRPGNRLEGLNAKIKAIYQKYTTFEQFLDDIFTTINLLEKEKNTRIANFLNKRTTILYPPDDFRARYSQLLTPYGFQKLETQFSFGDISFSFSKRLRCFIVMGKSFGYNTTIDSCSCYFSKSMGMPCKHIFAIRNNCKKDLFRSELVIDRWKNSYFLEHCAFLHESDMEDVPVTSQLVHVHMASSEDHSKPLSRQEKYKKTLVQAKLIANLAADIRGNSGYFHLNAMLDKIVTNLQSNNLNFDVVTQPIDDSDVIEID